MRRSILSKTILVLLAVLTFSQAQAEEDLVDAASASVGKSSAATPTEASDTKKATPIDAEAAISNFKGLACLKLEPGKGLEIKQNFSDSLIRIAFIAETCVSGGSKQSSVLRNGSKVYLESQPKCVDKNQLAGRNCLEQCSSHIQGIVSASQVLMAGMSQLSIFDSCSKMGELMKATQIGMTAFTGVCSASKALCDFSCDSAVGSLKDIKKTLEELSSATLDESIHAGCLPLDVQFRKDIVAVNLMLDQELSPTTLLSVASKQKECSGYAVNIAAAGVGILSALKQGSQANACEKATKGSQASADVCASPANKELPQCICKANPRSPGCSLADSTTTGTSGFNLPPATTPASNLKGTGTGLGSELGSGPSANNAGGSAAGGAAPPVGGGGGSANLGGGNGGSNDGRGEGSAITKMNTGIYGGEGGGGGGGGAFGRGGMASSAAGYNPALAQKISADREIASLRNQVSSQGGKSNWEKVKDRYTQEKTNLLGR